MQSMIKDFDCLDGFTFQHLHGVMLTNLNHISVDLKLSHSEYHLMGVLIGYWNKQHGKSFPTMKMLAKYARMSNSTIIKCINSLTNKGLILVIKDGKNGRQQYYINLKKLLTTNSNKSATKYSNPEVTTCSNAHEQTNRTKIIDKTIINKQKCFKQKAKANIKNDDVIFSKTKKSEVKDSEMIGILESLLKWNYSNPEKSLEKYGKTKLKEAIEFVQLKNPENPGAYLRTILKFRGKDLELNKNSSKSEQQIPLIERMIRVKYWKHIPTGKIYKVCPDIGNHLLINYCSETKTVYFLDHDFFDTIENFEIVENKSITNIDPAELKIKPDKEEILLQLIRDNKAKEALQLSKLWHIEIPEAV